MALTVSPYLVIGPPPAHTNTRFSCFLPPTDAVSVAIRVGAPLYVDKDVAKQMGRPASGPEPLPSNESHAQIVRSCREEAAKFVDPTTLYSLQLALAVAEERFADAAKCAWTGFLMECGAGGRAGGPVRCEEGPRGARFEDPRFSATRSMCRQRRAQHICLALCWPAFPPPSSPTKPSPPLALSRLQGVIAEGYAQHPGARALVAMQAALQDGRFEEAARHRDELRRVRLIEFQASAVGLDPWEQRNQRRTETDAL